MFTTCALYTVHVDNGILWGGWLYLIFFLSCSVAVNHLRVCNRPVLSLSIFGFLAPSVFTLHSKITGNVPFWNLYFS